MEKNETMNYDDWEKEIETLPTTWYPALIIKMVEEAYRKKVFVTGGASTLIQRVENKSQGLIAEEFRHSTAANDRNVICEIGRLFWGENKQCYSADAVLRAVKDILDGKACPSREPITISS